MNILICSVGRRVKLIQYFKEELHKMNGKVIAIDCDQTAPALHHADLYEVVPRINHPDYIPYIKDLCTRYKVNGVLSLIDPELSLLAGHKDYFEKDGIKIIVSEKQIVDLCYDKYLTYKLLADSGIPSVPTYNDLDNVLSDLKDGKLQFPLIVKPKNGSASIGIYKVNCINELDFFCNSNQDMIIQPFINGEEFGVDCYIDLMTGETINIFMKRKISMRAGETDKSIAVIDPELNKLIEKLINTLKPVGPIDVDCFKTNNKYIISEVNPRFGGGYLHAHEAGHNFVSNIINNLSGESNVPNQDNYEDGTILVKHDHCLLLNPDNCLNYSAENKIKIPL